MKSHFNLLRPMLEHGVLLLPETRASIVHRMGSFEGYLVSESSGPLDPSLIPAPGPFFSLTDSNTARPQSESL